MSQEDNPKRSLVEVLTFRGIECAALILRLFVMLYFCMQAFKHYRHIQNKDMYSVATFVLLAISLTMFFFSRISDFTEQTLIAVFDHDSMVAAWFQEHDTLIRVCRAFCRILVGYLCQNLAFLVNIERWLVILQQGQKRAFIATIFILILNALILSTLWLAEWKYFEWLMALAQGSINIGLSLKYELVLTKIINYHQKMLDRFEKLYEETEKTEIKSSTYEARTFFTYIQQQLLIQTIYLFALSFKSHFKQVLWFETVFDIINTLLLISYIWMYIGITASITRAYKAHCKQQQKTLEC